MIPNPFKALFPPCVFGDRIRPCGDRFCVHPTIGGGGVRSLEFCLACVHAGSAGSRPPAPLRVGDSIAMVIAERFGQIPKEGCDCQSKINELNGHPPDWARERLPMIVGWIDQNAVQLKRWVKVVPKFVRRHKLRRVVLEGLRRCEESWRVWREWEASQSLTGLEIGSGVPARP